MIASSAWADSSASVLIAESERSLISATAYFWHEKQAKETIEQTSQAAAAVKYTPLAEETMFDLSPQDRLWIRLDIDRKSDALGRVILWIPLPLLDSVTLYEQAANGTWKSAKAGDRVPVASWPDPGRHPRFRLDVPVGKSSVYLQVQGSTPLSIPLHLGGEVQAETAERGGYLGLGVIVGLLLTLVLICMVTAYTYQDRLYMLYGLYVMLMILAVSAYAGLAAHLLWPSSPQWADASQGVLAMLASGGALYFIEAMIGARQFARRLSAVLLSLGALAVPLAVLYYFSPRFLGVILLGGYMLVITTVGLTLAVRAWLRGDQVGKWVLLAYLPLSLAVLLAIARTYGWVSISWLVQYGIAAALLIEAPLMMVAMNVRSRGRHEINTREEAMKTQDALTGLLTEHIFDDRIRQAFKRAVKSQEDSAVVLISLVNYNSISSTHGLPVAEQSVLRAVIKLRKVLRNVETVARIGTSHFGLILEGASHRHRVTDMGARLIAQGLMPLPGLVPEVTLHFHLAAAVLKDMPTTDYDIKASLHALLSSMSPRTRRPIRFMTPTSLGGTPLAKPSTSHAVDALTAKIRAAEIKPNPQAVTSRLQDPSTGSSTGGHSSRPDHELPGSP